MSSLPIVDNNLTDRNSYDTNVLPDYSDLLHDQTHPPQYASLVETTILPPYSEIICVVTVTSHFIPGTFVLLQGLSYIPQRYFIVVASTLATVTFNSNLPLRVINPTASQVVLHADMKLATADPISENTVNYTVNHINSVTTTPTSDLPIDLSTSILTDEQRTQLLNLLNSYRDVFAVDMSELGRTSLLTHSIDIEAESPIRSRPYRVNHVTRGKIQTHIDDMLAQDVIEPSNSPWSFPVILVKKNRWF